MKNSMQATLSKVVIYTKQPNKEWGDPYLTWGCGNVLLRLYESERGSERGRGGVREGDYNECWACMRVKRGAMFCCWMCMRVERGPVRVVLEWERFCKSCMRVVERGISQIFSKSRET